MQTLFKSIITYIQNFVYPWHVPRYIHNTILKLFTKPRSWTFHTILNAPPLQMVSKFQSDLTVYLTLYFKHIQHIQIPGLFRHVILQQGIFSHIHNIRHIETYLPAFGYISEDSGIFKILAQLEIFMYIKAYSESVAYSVIFRTTEIFSRFQTSYSRAIPEQFMYILNLI